MWVMWLYWDSHVMIMWQSCENFLTLEFCWFGLWNGDNQFLWRFTITYVSCTCSSPAETISLIPRPSPQACSTSGGTFSHVSDVMGRNTSIDCGQHDYNIVSHVTWPYTFHCQHTSCVCERSCHMRAWICRATAQRDQSTRWTLCPPNCLVKSDKKSPSCTAVIWLGIVALQCVRVGEVVCGLHDQIISPAGDVTQVRKCSRPSPS